jgi:hypothetical protein
LENINLNKKMNFQLRNLKEEGKLDQGEEPTGEDVVDLENDNLSEVTSISEENQVILNKINILYNPIFISVKYRCNQFKSSWRNDSKQRRM